MAAGQGTRMRSRLPKVLHRVCGRAMVDWVVTAARTAGAEDVICVTRPGDGVAEAAPAAVEIVEQRDGEGTGAAVLAARAELQRADVVVVLSGDHPPVSPTLVADLVAAHERER